tara:strand:- start:404 stop:625 length:222 start_codon:yes stop_codon:yes gene_type:complete
MSSSGIFSFKSSEKVKPKVQPGNSIFQRGMSGKMILEVPEKNQMVNKKKMVKQGSVGLKPLKYLSSRKISKTL